MKILLLVLSIIATATLNAQKTSIRGYRYEKTIKNNPELSVYTKADKKIYVLWRHAKPLVWPNPTNSMVYFSEYGDAIVMDSLGRILKRETGVNQINLARYAAGIYYITIITNDYVTHHPIVKQ